MANLGLEILKFITYLFNNLTTVVVSVGCSLLATKLWQVKINKEDGKKYVKDITVNYFCIYRLLCKINFDTIYDENQYNKICNNILNCISNKPFYLMRYYISKDKKNLIDKYLKLIKDLEAECLNFRKTYMVLCLYQNKLTHKLSEEDKKECEYSINTIKITLGAELMYMKIKTKEFITLKSEMDEICDEEDKIVLPDNNSTEENTNSEAE